MVNIQLIHTQNFPQLNLKFSKLISKNLYVKGIFYALHFMLEISRTLDFHLMKDIKGYLVHAGFLLIT